MILKYMNEPCSRCATASTEGNMVAVSNEKGEVWVYELDTSELIHTIHVGSYIESLTFTTDNKQLWVGERDGHIHVCDTFTGKAVKSGKVGGEDESVIFVQIVGENVICGSRKGTVTLISTTTFHPTNTWETGELTYTYGYNHTKQQLITGHENMVKCLTLSGEEVTSVKVKDEVFGLDVHPVDEDVVACGVKFVNDEYDVVEVCVLKYVY